MTQTFIRLDRMQQGLYEVLGFALGARFSTPPTLSWGYGEQSFETTSDGGLISLSVIAGPSPLLRSQSRGQVIADTQSIDVRVVAASATRYSITLNQVNYAYQATGADTPTTIRDALLALIQQDEATGYASSATVALGPDSLTISKAPTAGGLWQLRLAGPLVSENRVDTGQSLMFTDGQVQFGLGVQTFSKEREPRDGAWALTMCVLAALQRPNYVQALDAWGIGLGAKTTPQDISAIAGANWSTRNAFSVTVNMYSAWTEPVSTADAISAILNLQQPSNTQTIVVQQP